MKRHTAKALPDYRKASIRVGHETPEVEAQFKAVCRREDEKARLAGLYQLLEPPAMIDGKKLTKGEVDAYTLAVNHARGTTSKPEEFLKLTGTMSKRASSRFFTVCASAMDAVKRERESAWNETDGHRMAALQAKLELEENLGCLPTQKQAKDRAFQILQRCRWAKFAPMAPENKRWSKIFSSVNLDYLPQAVKGKS